MSSAEACLTRRHHHGDHGHVGVEPYVPGRAGSLRQRGERVVIVLRSGRQGLQHPADSSVDRAGRELLTQTTAVADVAVEATPATFETLFLAIYGRVREFAARQIGLDGADDLAAATFATAWARWADAPREPDQQRAWVFGIARNKVREHIRAKGRRAALQARVRDLVRPHGDDVSGAVTAVDRSRRLLATLPVEQREAVALTVLAGLTPKEAGEVLGCSASAVTSRVHRARATLSRAIAQEAGSDA